MITKITSFTAHQTAEGMRITFTYSLIDEDGNIVKSNQRATTIALKEEITTAIATIDKWLLEKVPQ